MYNNGEGVPEDDVQAMAWLRKAAEQGLSKAQNNLGVMYANGDGVPEDDVTAYAWLNLAAARDNDPGVLEAKDQIAQQMTREQIAEAQKLSRELAKRIYGD